MEEHPGANAGPRILWEASQQQRDASELQRFLSWLRSHRGLCFDSYDSLWRWSVSDLPGFWTALCGFMDIGFHAPAEKVLEKDDVEHARWFQGAMLNFAERALQSWSGNQVAIRARSQTRSAFDMTFDDVRSLVAAIRAGLLDLGVRRGDRVVAWMPNLPETVAALFATASIGAVWSSCAPELGVRSVVDRFAQIEPKVLLAIDGYMYGDRSIDKLPEVFELRGLLPTLESTVLLNYRLPELVASPLYIRWSDFLLPGQPLTFDPVPFDHPLWILYSSGTTGKPKAIVHGHGGITLELLKAWGLMYGLRKGDTAFTVASTSWMVWNHLVASMLTGSTIVCFDGNPLYPNQQEVWRLMDECGVSNATLSSAFLSNARKTGTAPPPKTRLERLRVLGATGSPLPAEVWEWVYQNVKADVLLSSASGGTEVCTAFVTGNILLPVVAGEIACRALGVRVEAFNEEGRSVVDERGELVITAPMPSMPLGFWGDVDGKRYHATYFGYYPGVWRHGDWITITSRGTCIIHGRSDATLNRGGVRLGTGEYYSLLEELPQLRDALVVHLEDADGGMGRLVLMVSLMPDAVLDDALRLHIHQKIKTRLSPRHVPDVIAELSAIPLTSTGKRLELPAKRILLGEDPAGVTLLGNVSNPESLNEIAVLGAQLRGRRLRF